MFYRNYACQCQ